MERPERHLPARPADLAAADRRFARNVIFVGSAVLIGLLLLTLPLLRPTVRAVSPSTNQMMATRLPVEPMMLPLVDGQGRLAGYVDIVMEIEVAAEYLGHVRARLPMVQHAINLAAWKTPVARSDAAAAHIDRAAMEAMLTEAARRATDTDSIRAVRVLAANPA